MKAWFKDLHKKLFSRVKKVTPKREERIGEPEDEHSPWWDNFFINEEQSRYFKIGNIILCIDRYNREWHINSYQDNEDIHDSLSSSKTNFSKNPSVSKNPSDIQNINMHSKKPYKSFAAQGSNEISLKPALPNRAILSELEHPFYIPAGESVLLYVSTPLWIQIETGTPSILLEEVPTEILPDTWFGKNTLEGELCFANENNCSARLEEIKQDNTRVISPILITNRTKDTLLLRDFKVPLPYLSIYVDNEYHLWTEQLNIYQEDYHLVETAVVKGPPKMLKETQLIQSARFGYKPGLKNIFSSLKWM